MFGRGSGASAGPPPAAVLPPTVAPPPAPPAWSQSLDEANMQMQLPTPFIRVPVRQSTAEFRVLAELFGSSIGEVNRIVNPELWKRFTRTRADLLAAKSDDVALLTELGLSEKEVIQRAAAAGGNSASSPVRSPYSDNVLLLFHGCRGAASGGGGAGAVDTILSQGLDERLGNGGTFGKGIYFADDPQKAMQYDSHGVLLVFAVMLGDCLAVGGGGGVREPEKGPGQKRNARDLFFDSTVGRGTHNEYVVFNRAQCCPLYTIQYTRSQAARYGVGGLARYNFGHDDGGQALGGSKNTLYATARGSLPSFAWNNGYITSSTPPSPFYARQLFTAMGAVDDTRNPAPSLQTPNQNSLRTGGQVDPHQDELQLALALSKAAQEDEELQLAIQLSQQCAAVAGGATNDLGGAKFTELGAVGGARAGGGDIDDGDSLALKLAQLADLEFFDVAKNERLLRKYGLDLERTIQHLVEEATTAVQPQAATRREEEECPICSTEYTSASSAKWQVLRCGHKTCGTCHSRIQSSDVTMSGQRHSFTKCPFCQACSGVQIGTCPNGSMSVQKTPQSAAGYEGYGSIVIQYQVHGGGQLGRNETCYLPDNTEGRRVLRLLQIAWDRRLCFAIGTSATTGRSGALVWNIHHKTSLQGGTHGYPDPNYLQRVTQELKEFGVE